MGYKKDDTDEMFDHNINGWVTVPPDLKLPDNQPGKGI